jgi:hypothetical protein
MQSDDKCVRMDNGWEELGLGAWGRAAQEQATLSGFQRIGRACRLCSGPMNLNTR